MTWITVATAHETEWSKRAALRAAATEQVQGLLERLLTDLAHLGEQDQPRLDYLEPGALDTIREDPETFQVVGRLAVTGEGHPACRTTTYWPEHDGEPVDVELEVQGQGITFGPDLVPLPMTRSRKRIVARVEPGLGRISRLQLS